MAAALKLHDIDDAAQFVAIIVTRSGLRLSFHDREDSNSFSWSKFGGSASATSPESSGEDLRSGPTSLSASASSTGKGNDSGGLGGEVTSESSHGSSASTPTIPTEIVWETLSKRGQAILRQVGTRLSDGYTPSEIGRELGISRSSVSSLVDELRTELERLALPR
jgi:hypothetical protein